ncbi:MAG: hypothetical protein KC800_23510 [Candidatus Eremiobacteraeota bacterium]|nr:hypothetical protein [Candidatus Eremiobacteraeota bacterium]
MKFLIDGLEIRFGVPVFAGTLQESAIAVGDEVEIVRDEKVLAAGLICGVLVDGKALDRADPGKVVQCTIRGQNVDQAGLGDLVRGA